jgi:hypothetical protein
MPSFNELGFDLIPICAGCKKILNVSGVWSRAEAVQDHSKVLFTHALCPDCMVKYGWLDDKTLLPSSSDGCEIDKGPRAQEKPSDHTPIIVTLSDLP